MKPRQTSQGLSQKDQLVADLFTAIKNLPNGVSEVDSITGSRETGPLDKAKSESVPTLGYQIKLEREWEKALKDFADEKDVRKMKKTAIKEINNCWRNISKYAKENDLKVRELISGYAEGVSPQEKKDIPRLAGILKDSIKKEEREMEENSKFIKHLSVIKSSINENVKQLRLRLEVQQYTDKIIEALKKGSASDAALAVTRFGEFLQKKSHSSGKDISFIVNEVELLKNWKKKELSHNESAILQILEDMSGNNKNMKTGIESFVSLSKKQGSENKVTVNIKKAEKNELSQFIENDLVKNSPKRQELEKLIDKLEQQAHKFPTHEERKAASTLAKELREHVVVYFGKLNKGDNHYNNFVNSCSLSIEVARPTIKAEAKSSWRETLEMFTLKIRSMSFSKQATPEQEQHLSRLSFLAANRAFLGTIKEVKTLIDAKDNVNPHQRKR